MKRASSEIKSDDPKVWNPKIFQTYRSWVSMYSPKRSLINNINTNTLIIFLKSVKKQGMLVCFCFSFKFLSQNF